ncbi:hypothetical protein [Geomesophilobacter sediminis]|uniref:SCP2 domain-containing protein n=1 Tax=Geomesophilobacter sediminis TaxID=2798584 RepID=A0A8J7JHD9_9BACT|nr:hypothetical protein [Geomesophilobacter sediminis]MBJ6723885.1 hypothetical protein [Geomesophilobacter sediminis]
MTPDVIDTLITELGKSFKKGVFSAQATFYFQMGSHGATATVDGESSAFERGKTVESPDCTCQTSEEMFRKIWFEGYRPGLLDFIGGKIKTNNPLMLQQFLQAFGK